METEEYKHKKIETKQTIEYSEILSVIEDLKVSNQYCLLLKRYIKLEQNEENKLLQRSLWESSLVSFFRCFKSGIRKFHLTDNIYSHIKGETIDFFNYLENTRDKHIAHSANSMSNVLIGICIDENNDVIDTSYMITRHVGENEHNIDMFILLVEEALKHCIEIASKYHNDIFQYAKSLSKEEILKLEDLQYIIPDILKSAKKNRKQV